MLIIIIDRKIADDQETDDDKENHEITPFFFEDQEGLIEQLINKKHVLSYRPVPVSKN